MENPKCPYCIHCDAPVDRIDYSAKLETFEVKGGAVITYVEVSAHCHECGMELYIPEINDMNKLSRDNAYAAAMERADLPVVRGKWLDGRCTNCAWELPDYEYYGGYEIGNISCDEFNFCPNCGANMRKE